MVYFLNYSCAFLLSSALSARIFVKAYTSHYKEGNYNSFLSPNIEHPLCQIVQISVPKITPSSFLSVFVHQITAPPSAVPPSAVSPSAVPCPDCGKLMSGRASLSRHIRDVHLKLKPWKCQLCNTSFTRRRNLDNHVVMLHETRRSVVCRFCDASFSHDSHRTLHEQKAHSQIYRLTQA